MQVGLDAKGAAVDVDVDVDVDVVAVFDRIDCDRRVCFVFVFPFRRVGEMDVFVCCDNLRDDGDVDVGAVSPFFDLGWDFIST